MTITKQQKEILEKQLGEKKKQWNRMNYFGYGSTPIIIGLTLMMLFNLLNIWFWAFIGSLFGFIIVIIFCIPYSVRLKKDMDEIEFKLADRVR